jgi:glycopeptide antibiotics resistance protein
MWPTLGGPRGHRVSGTTAIGQHRVCGRGPEQRVRDGVHAATVSEGRLGRRTEFSVRVADSGSVQDHRDRRSTAAVTGVRLSVALLGYFVLVTLVITLSPFDFAAPRAVPLVLWLVPADMLANVALFLPLGFLVRSLDTGTKRGPWRVVFLMAGFSLLIEVAQIFIRDRYGSPIDVLTNTCGGYLGMVLRDRLERWGAWQPGLAGRLGLDIPLVGLLYLLVPQLWLNGVGVVDDSRRIATTLLLGSAGSIVLVALHRHRWDRDLRFATRVVPPLALLWFTVGALPAMVAAPATFGALALAIVLFTAWLVRRRPDADGRRFEIATLRRLAPVFSLYLLLAALWPPFRPIVPWHGAIGFVDRLNDAGVVELLLLLEQVGGFTLLGYAAAEWRGRRNLTLTADLPRLVLAVAVFTLALEGVQGLLAGPGASLVRALLATSGAVYGAGVYHLARTHLRALRAARPPAAAATIDEAA